MNTNRKVRTLWVPVAAALLAVSAGASNRWTPPVGSLKVEGKIAGPGTPLIHDVSTIDVIGRMTASGDAAIFGGESLTLRSVSGSGLALRLPVAGRVGSAAVERGRDGLLLAWSEESEQGRAVFAQEISNDGSLAGPRLVLAVPPDMGGSMHQPGVEVAWNGKSYGVAWLQGDGSSVHFAEVSRGRVEATTMVGEGATVWPQVAALRDGFAVAWLDRTHSIGEIRCSRIRRGSSEPVSIPGMAYGAFDMAAAGDTLLVAADMIATERTDQVVIRLAPQQAPVTTSLGETWDKEHDPGLTILDDGSLLVARAIRNVHDRMEVSVVRVVGDAVLDVARAELGDAQEVRAPRVALVDGSLHLIWSDDRAAPFQGRHIPWSLRVDGP